MLLKSCNTRRRRLRAPRLLFRQRWYALRAPCKIAAAVPTVHACPFSMDTASRARPLVACLQATPDETSNENLPLSAGGSHDPPVVPARKETQAAERKRKRRTVRSRPLSLHATLGFVASSLLCPVYLCRCCAAVATRPNRPSLALQAPL